MSRRRQGLTAHETGLAAEDAAARHYEALGGQVQERRLRTPHGEIDLIIDAPDGLLFVEVKARRDGGAAWTITDRQQRRIEAAAQHYLAAADISPARNLRFDVALVDGAGRVEIIENAFMR